MGLLLALLSGLATLTQNSGECRACHFAAAAETFASRGEASRVEGGDGKLTSVLLASLVWAGKIKGLPALSSLIPRGVAAVLRAVRRVYLSEEFERWKREGVNTLLKTIGQM